MAIIGGAGNPVGGSYTGPAETLEIIGDHCYCTATPVSSAGSSADTTAVSFETGNFYVHFDYIGFTNTETSTTRTAFVDMFLNGTRIWQSRYNNTQNMRSDQPLRLIIPPYTSFEFKVGQADGTATWGINMTGRIYRG